VSCWEHASPLQQDRDILHYADSEPDSRIKFADTP
jgi:hypothetical protein